MLENRHLQCKQDDGIGPGNKEEGKSQIDCLFAASHLVSAPLRKCHFEERTLRSLVRGESHGGGDQSKEGDDLEGLHGD